MHLPRTTLAAALAAAAAGGLTAAPAHAALPKPFDLFSGKSATPGDAHAYGTVTFARRGQALVQGTLNDLCPADGHGAYLEVWVTFNGNGRFHTVRTLRDRSRCEGAGKTFRFWTPKKGNRRVTGVHFRVRECDKTAAGLRCTTDFSTADVER
ncbi:hypothetical protein [Conexibacter sp. SYSU D00693]|uniref:hypothetical protein n=1 Tax=Conexibacter sp. SYSU D00693 TaxID=2812560 RepID=UPI00196A7DE1|nr:hypothetical protein [Conexibacter sp. SYSU D00693]